MTKTRRPRLPRFFDRNYGVSDRDNGKDEFSSVWAVSSSILNKKYGIPLLHRNDITIGKLLGKGTFSKVYSVKLNKNLSFQTENDEARGFKRKAGTDSNNARYALKSLKKSSLSNDVSTFAARDLVKEATILAFLDHKGIIKIHGIGGIGAKGTRGQDSLFLIIDRIHVTLDQKLVEFKALVEKQARSYHNDMLRLKTEISLQIAKALAYMHERRIIFRDLKPQNVGFKKCGTVVLFDFGLCREMPQRIDATSLEPNDDDCYNMSMAGTLRYMAPEVMSWRGYNAKADVYSWAIVFYQMLALTTPFSEYSKLELFQKFVGQLAERPKLSHLDLPNDIKKVVKGAWRQSVCKRFSIDFVCQELQSIIQENNWDSQKTIRVDCISRQQ